MSDDESTEIVEETTKASSDLEDQKSGSTGAKQSRRRRRSWEDFGTSHISVIDKDEQMVSVTQLVFSSFGI